MVAGNWTNADGLPLQYGTSKAVPDFGGEFVMYGETREYEQYVGLVPFTFSTGTSSIVVPAAPTSFSGTTTFAAAGIVSPTSLIPLQTTAPQTAPVSGTHIVNQPQMFLESVEIETIIAAAGGTSLSIGLATIDPVTGAFVQVTPNAGVQLINAHVIANMNVTGKKAIWYQPGSTVHSVPASIAGGGTWIGSFPLVTNVISPLPQGAFVSAIATGAFTAGLLKFRMRYTLVGGTYQ